MFKKLTYRLISPIYDTLISSIEAERKRAIDLFRFRHGERLLIVGVGTGADLQFLPSDIEIEGIDDSPEMLKKAMKMAEKLKMDNVKLRIMDAESLNYPDNYFDKVILFLILSVVDNPRKAFSEAVRVLKTGGEMAVFDKFLKHGQKPDLIRKGANIILSNFGTDINRIFEDIIEGQPVQVAKKVRSTLRGFFMIYLCRKENRRMESESVFDKLTNQYDAWYDSAEGRPLYESELRCLRPLVEASPGPILEIGVGTGRFAMHFPGVTGLDPSLNALKMAEKRGVKTVHGYGENLPFEDETFGCILIIVTLCFVENPIDVLRETKRVLRKGGSIIIGLVPKDSPWGAFYEEKKRAGHPFYSDARFYTFKEIENMLQTAGLKISRIRSTLLQRPDDSRRIEEPVEGNISGAGFLCMEVKRGRDDQ
jgi:ubiquinone/menaquinone biosynthesis C-methylase UbiE